MHSGTAPASRLESVQYLHGLGKPGATELSDYRRGHLLNLDSQSLSTSADYRLAVSPNGGTIVYAGQGNHLWLRHRDELLATRLPGTEGAFSPSFSPDGARLAFVSGVPRGLRVLTLGSSTVSLLTDSLVDRGGVSWGSDGYIYYDGHLEGDGLARIRASGGTPEIFTRPRADSGESYHIAPGALPDGRHVLLSIRRQAVDVTWDIAVADTRTGEHTVLVRAGLAPRYSPTGHLVYATESGGLMAVRFDPAKARLTGEPVEIGSGVGVRGNARADISLSREGTLVYSSGAAGGDLGELVWIGRDGQATQVDPEWLGAFERPALSPDGRHLAVVMARGAESSLWVKQLDRGPASRLTFEGDATTPSWFPDGRRLLFGLGKSGPAQPFTVPADGSTLPVPLRGDSLLVSAPSLSRDGRWVVYQQAGNLYAVPTTGDSARLTLADSRFNEFLPSLSPDNRWLAYMSDESGSFEVYVRPFPATSSAKRQVSTGSGLMPFWSRDGRELFFQGPDGDLFSALVTSSAASFSVGQPRRLFRMDGLMGSGNNALPWLTPSPDGRRFMGVRRVGARGSRDEIVVIDNLPALLAERKAQ